VLALPGVFTVALDADAHAITGVMELATARPLAAVVSDDKLAAAYFAPTVSNPSVEPAIEPERYHQKLWIPHSPESAAYLPGRPKRAAGVGAPVRKERRR
jgi:hypothetical protein